MDTQGVVDRALHGVCAFVSGFNHNIGWTFYQISIVTHAADQCVIADSSIKRVIACATVDAVIAIFTTEHVVAAVSRDGVVQAVAHAVEVGCSRQGQFFDVLPNGVSD